MKKILVFLAAIIISSCSANTSSSIDGVLVTKFKIHYHHSENCKGHHLLFDKVETQIDDHDFWYIYLDGDCSDFIFVHSPDCKKCKGETQSILSTSSEKSDYWGW